MIVDDLLRRRSCYTAQTYRAARRCVADALACAGVGTRGDTYEQIAAAMAPLLEGGERRSTVWFKGRSGSLVEAIYLNSTAAAADDLDDGHRGAIGHPGSALVPAVLGFAEATRFSGDILGSLAFGYDAATIIARHRILDRVPTTATGRWAAYGVAAALADLSGASPDVLRSALARAGTLSPQWAPPSPAAPDGLKEGIAWASLAGLAAFELARAGVDAPVHLLDEHPEFETNWFQAGTNTPAVEEIYFKQYACCRWIHPALDIVFDLRRTGQMPDDPSEISAIEVETFAQSLKLPNHPRPRTLEDAHYSFPFCVALAVFAQPEEFLPLRPSALEHRDAMALSDKVSVRENARLTQQFPVRTPVNLTVATPHQRIRRTAPTAIGDPSLPISDALLAQKHAFLLRNDKSIRDELEATLCGDGPLTLPDLRNTLGGKDGKERS